VGGKHCAQDQNGVPHCIRCRAHCPPSSPSDLVCGGDGQTYSSLCALERYTCLTGRPIRLAYRGSCRRTTPLSSPFSRIHCAGLADVDISSLVKTTNDRRKCLKKKKKRKKKEKLQKNESYTEVITITKKMKQASGNKRVFTKTVLTYGKDVTMSSRTQTTEVLLAWKYVRQAVERALYTLEQFTISEAKIFRSLFSTK